MNKLIDFARYLKSDKNGVFICLIGTIAQALHTYNIILYSSQLQTEWMRYGQAIVIGLFFSLSLTIYTFRAGSVIIKDSIDFDSKRLKSKYKNYAVILAVFEFLVNIHYWTRKFIIEKLNSNIEISIIDWYDWGIVLVVSFFLPYMISTYAGHIYIPEKNNKYDNSVLEKLNNEGLEFNLLSNKKDKEGSHIVKLKLK